MNLAAEAYAGGLEGTVRALVDAPVTRNNGVDVNGKKIKEEGTWKLNANKQIVAGDYTMGIDDSGYLLKDTGERDGKGRKMKYAFAKS